ncbi:hypothetical protein L1887_17392 [Cichorium endivia]|nr:hypothetical protein L1887_17392 [Cichorium endivia]
MLFRMEKKEGSTCPKFKHSSPRRKKSERILKKSAFSKFTNQASNHVPVDIDVSSSPSKEPIIPSSKKIRCTKAGITSSPSKKITGFATATVVPMEGPLHIQSETRSKKRNDHLTRTDKKKRRTSKVEVVKPLSVSDSDFEVFVANRGIPSLWFWSVDDMVRRQDFELKHGGFGIGEFQEFIVPNETQPENRQDSEDASVEFQLDYMVEYFESVNHPKAEEFKRVEVTRLEMSWMTLDNHTDCGVFTMRHMETFLV